MKQTKVLRKITRKQASFLSPLWCVIAPKSVSILFFLTPLFPPYFWYQIVSDGSFAWQLKQEHTTQNKPNVHKEATADMRLKLMIFMYFTLKKASNHNWLNTKTPVPSQIYFTLKHRFQWDEVLNHSH